MKKGKKKLDDAPKSQIEMNRCETNRMQVLGIPDGTHISVRESRLNEFTTSEGPVDPKIQQTFYENTSSPYIAESSNQGGSNNQEEVTVRGPITQFNNANINKVKIMGPEKPIEPIDFMELLQKKYMSKPLIELLLFPQKKYPEIYRDKEGLLNSYYTQLTIIEHNERNEHQKLTLPSTTTNNQEYHDNRLASYEDIYGQKKAAIDIESIFKQGEKEPTVPKRLLLLGRAGIGKSTLMQYIARKHHALWEGKYDLAILLPLRRLQSFAPKQLTLNKYDKSGWLAKFIHDVYFSADLEIEVKHIEQALSTLDNERILYLLDGYDEATHLYTNNTDNELPRHPIPHLLLEVLLNKPNVIVSTRPHAQPETAFDRELENMGFNDEQIAWYVHGFFNLIEKIKDKLEDITVPSTEQAKECYEYLKQYPSIWGTCHVPIGLELVVSIWNGKAKLDEIKNATITSLYQEIAFVLQKNYLANQQRKDIRFWKPTRIEENCKQEMLFLQYLAFKGLTDSESTIILSNQLVVGALEEFKIDEDDYENFITRLCQIGVLKQIGGEGDNVLTCEYYYIHLTFQEFFAAKYLVSLLTSQDKNQQEEANTFIKEQKYIKRFQYMLWFAVGLLKDNENALNGFLEIFFQAPRELFGDYEALFLMHCMNEANLLKKIDLQTQNYIESIVLDSLWRGLSKKYGLNDIYFNDVFRGLSHCHLVLQSPAVENLIIDMLSFESKDETITLKSVIKKINHLSRVINIINFLNKILPHLHNNFLRNVLYTKLEQLLNVISEQQIHLSILELLVRNYILFNEEKLFNLLRKKIPDLLVLDENKGMQHSALSLLDKLFFKLTSDQVTILINVALSNFLKGNSTFIRVELLILLLKHFEKIRDEMKVEVSKHLPWLVDQNRCYSGIGNLVVLTKHSISFSKELMEIFIRRCLSNLINFLPKGCCQSYEQIAMWFDNYLNIEILSQNHTCVQECLLVLIFDKSKYSKSSIHTYILLDSILKFSKNYQAKAFCIVLLQQMLNSDDWDLKIKASNLLLKYYKENSAEFIGKIIEIVTNSAKSEFCALTNEYLFLIRYYNFLPSVLSKIIVTNYLKIYNWQFDNDRINEHAKFILIILKHLKFTIDRIMIIELITKAVPKIIIHTRTEFREKIFIALSGYLDNLKGEEIESFLEHVLPAWSTHNHWRVKLEAIKLYSKYFDNQLKNNIALIINATAEYLLVYPYKCAENSVFSYGSTLECRQVMDWQVKARTIRMLLKNRKCISIDLRNILIQKTLPSLLYHNKLYTKIEGVALLLNYNPNGLIYEQGSFIISNVFPNALKNHPRITHFKFFSLLLKSSHFCNPTKFVELVLQLLPILLNDVDKLDIVKKKKGSKNIGICVDDYIDKTTTFIDIKKVVQEFEYFKEIDEISLDELLIGLISNDVNMQLMAARIVDMNSQKINSDYIDVMLHITLQNVLQYHHEVLMRIDAARLLFKFNNRISVDSALIILSKILPGSFNQYNNDIRCRVMSLFWKYFDSGFISVLSDRTSLTMPNIFNKKMYAEQIQDKKDYATKSICLLENFYANAPANMLKAFIQRILPDLLAYNNYNVQKNAARMLKKYIDNDLYIKFFSSAVRKFFDDNEDEELSKNISDALANEFTLSQLFKFSKLLKYPIYFKRILKKAHDENAIIYFSETLDEHNEKEFVLYYGRHSSQTKVIKYSLMKTMNLKNIQKQLIAFWQNRTNSLFPRMENDVHAIYEYAISDELLHYHNQLSYHIAQFIILAQKSLADKKYYLTKQHIDQCLKHLYPDEEFLDEILDEYEMTMPLSKMKRVICVFFIAVLIVPTALSLPSEDILKVLSKLSFPAISAEIMIPLAIAITVILALNCTYAKIRTPKNNSDDNTTQRNLIQNRTFTTQPHHTRHSFHRSIDSGVAQQNVNNIDPLDERNKNYEIIDDENIPCG